LEEARHISLQPKIADTSTGDAARHPEEENEWIGGDVEDAGSTGPARDVYQRGDTRNLPTTRVLATRLFWLLAIIVIGHYTVVTCLVWNGKADIKLLEAAFNSSLPVVAGLVGTAAAFFFKDRGR
jgi:hypothetical protein